MRERVESLGGRLWIGSAQNGLCIEAIIPIGRYVLNSSLLIPALSVHRASVDRDALPPARSRGCWRPTQEVTRTPRV